MARVAIPTVGCTIVQSESPNRTSDITTVIPARTMKYPSAWKRLIKYAEYKLGMSAIITIQSAAHDVSQSKRYTSILTIVTVII